MAEAWNVTEESILGKVTEKSFARGRGYFESGMVESVVRRGDRLFAEVLGSDEDSYSVGVAFDGGDFSASCTCLYDWGGYCKHIVAVLLTWVNDRDLAEQRTPVEDLLSSLDADGLRSLVFAMLKGDPGLVDVIDDFCREVAPTT